LTRRGGADLHARPKPADRLIVALDVESLDTARALIGALAAHVGWFKVGSELFTREGPRACALVKDAGAKLFLDLKFHDIPNQVHGAVKSALSLGADMLTVHASGGPAMLRAARESAEKSGRADAILVAVTVLTHFSEEEFNALFAATRRVEDSVIAFARVARESGMTGVVASARELPAIKRALGHDFVVVTPGIRLPGAGPDDQTRVVTPEQALRDGADYIVVGRPITAAKDPAAACGEMLKRMSLGE
jgi:orotidine-5'-phosphate decarboxylase